MRRNAIQLSLLKGDERFLKNLGGGSPKGQPRVSEVHKGGGFTFIRTFCADRKYQRTRHRVKIVAMFFAQELLCNILWSNIACRSSLFVSVQALRDSCGYSVIKENITLPHFKHFLAYSWTETGSHSIFNSAVILEITYAYGKLLIKGNV